MEASNLFIHLLYNRVMLVALVRIRSTYAWTDVWKNEAYLRKKKGLSETLTLHVEIDRF